MRFDAIIDDLVLKKVVKESICTHNNDIIVFHFMLVINCIVGKFAILTTLIWEIE